MKHLIFISLCVLCLLSSVTHAAERPNVLLILADDLGFSDVGCYGGEIATPNLDQLAADGLQYTQFYNTARCWPTRAAILTGYYAQQVRRDNLAGVPSGGGGKRPTWARLLPDLLRPLGYRSYHSGKWHVDGMPLAGGFDRSYYLRDQGRFFNPTVHYEDDQKLPAIAPSPTNGPTGYYGTKAIADHAIKSLQDHEQNHSDSPFFHYLAFTAPHFPLHAPAEDIAQYADKYQNGWRAAREQRWQKIKSRGIVNDRLSPVERQVGPPYDHPKAIEQLGPGEVNRRLPWSELDEQQRTFQAAKMAIHAAMIDRMDREIGRVLDQIRKMGQFENTLILFLSDNGASAEIMVRDDGHDPNASPGSAATYLCLGPGWSTTSNTPFRRHKTWTHEGGISTPLIAHWPKGFAGTGQLRHNVGHVIDLVPTILEVAGGTVPQENKDQGVPAMPGKSLVSTFARDLAVDREYLWWYHNKNRAIRVGDWKLVADGLKGPWELYNLKSDRTETTDLSGQYPDKVQSLAKAWQSHHDEFRETASRDLPKRKR